MINGYLYYNTKDFLRNCLKSVYERTFEVNYEIIVVDNASSDNSCQMIENEFPQVLLIKSQKNLGFGRGNNLGINQAKGKYIFLLNPVCEFIQL